MVLQDMSSSLVSNGNESISTGLYAPKESYILNIKKSRNTLAEPLNRRQNKTLD